MPPFIQREPKVKTNLENVILSGTERSEVKSKWFAVTCSGFVLRTCQSQTAITWALLPESKIRTVLQESLTIANLCHLQEILRLPTVAQDDSKEALSSFCYYYISFFIYFQVYFSIIMLI